MTGFAPMPFGSATSPVAETPGCAAVETSGTRPRGPTVQLEGEEKVGQLAVAVGLVGVVRRLGVALEHRLVTSVVGDRGHRHHARLGPQQCRQQQAGQREVAEVVRAELQLVALLGLAVLRRRHHPGVVDQQVERTLEPGHEGVDRRSARRGRAPRPWPCPSTAGRLAARLGVAAGQDDLGAVVGQRLAVWKPMPELAPVTTARVPARSGRSSGVKPAGRVRRSCFSSDCGLVAASVGVWVGSTDRSVPGGS